nr:hypothetical protein [Candidatus Bathyarchaeota archaeon]
MGNELLAKAGRVTLWASPADFPLPKSFTEGRETFQEILALPNPINRVSEIHAHKETLESGSDAIRSLAAFHEKWGTVYTEMNGFAVNLNGIEHLLPREGACRSFLDEFRTAKDSARVADTQVWKDLQGAKAQANLELAKLIASWRDEARQAVSETLDKLPEMLKSTGLEPGLTAKLSKPLIGFRDYIDEENLPIRVAALSDRVALLVGDLRDAIMREM